MGTPSEPQPAKLFMSLIAGKDDLFDQGMEALKMDFGEIDFISEKLRFDFTDYYAQEMGENLFRHFITFGPLISRDSFGGEVCGLERESANQYRPWLPLSCTCYSCNDKGLCTPALSRKGNLCRLDTHLPE